MLWYSWRGFLFVLGGLCPPNEKNGGCFESTFPGWIRGNSLLPISGFVLNLMLIWHILHMYYQENAKLFFPFFISSYFSFFPDECPGLCRHTQFKIFFLIWISHSFKKGASNKTISYFDQSFQFSGLWLILARDFGRR